MMEAIVTSAPWKQQLHMMAAERPLSTTSTASCPASDYECLESISVHQNSPMYLEVPAWLEKTSPYIEAPPGLEKMAEVRGPKDDRALGTGSLRDSLQTKGASVLIGMQLNPAPGKSSRRRGRERWENQRRQAQHQLRHERELLRKLVHTSRESSKGSSNCQGHEQQNIQQMQQNIRHLQELEFLFNMQMQVHAAMSGPPAMYQVPHAFNMPGSGFFCSQRFSL
eukprot:TRINITY_DN11010_c0_g1_i3.p1 TRINITY_DN11010_c0_g1~~TRINITY_DN11010_c0_g1_i3.p1  ORF type:complete len:224 (-),score=44.33 TRINITY_DN11010_c0_g1_i3:98-769(-)